MVHFLTGATLFSKITFLFNNIVKNGQTPASFIVYFRSFQTNIITIITSNICEKMSHLVYGARFEPMTFGT